MRAFIAIPLPGEIRSSVNAFERELGEAKGIRMVSAENLHLTLDFLGEINERERMLFAEKLKTVAEDTKTFSLSVSGVGTFPVGREPKVLWVGLEKSLPLLRLADNVKKAVGSRENKKFSPHLTVGRVKYPDDKQKSFWERFFQAKHRSFGTMKVDHFLLMKSDLSGKTPVYTVMEKFMLKDGQKNG